MVETVAKPAKPATTKKARASGKEIAALCIRVLFDVLMGGLIAIGVLIIIAKGFSFPTLLIQIGSFKLIGLPFSYAIFGAFGLYLDRVYKWKAFWMLLFTYASWDLVDQIAQSFIAPNTGGANIPEILIWTTMIILSLYIVQPRINLNHFVSILVFAYYANLPFLENYMGSSPRTFIIELVEQLLWITLIAVSFYRHSDTRGIQIREFFLGYTKVPAHPNVKDFIVENHLPQQETIEVNEEAALLCEPK
jgi:hypothetical protein